MSALDGKIISHLRWITRRSKVMNSFIIASFIVILMPGTGFVYTISTGVTRGKKSGVYAAVGCTLAIIPHMIAGIFTMFFLTNINDMVFQSVKFVGVIYLIYLGITMIRGKVSYEMEQEDKKISNLKIGLKGMLINLLNPKLTVFFLAFIPQYIDKSERNILMQSIQLDMIFLVISLLVFLIYALLSGSVFYFIEKGNQKLSWLPRLSGIIFIVFSIQLLVSRI
ncbi:LysE family translocator [Candidatus Galacturonibacter soehngenii]|uniref:LysE family translocator n=2 Tax=Candidatus Galacturonatibacter soehngenii TaxID=2307010 RepID=A0A7V7UBQ3_9FIRM|nr:LysE family translocator [Candidatus Galacturonibacter soehngenii]